MPIAVSQDSYLAKYDATVDAQKFPLVRRWIDNEPLSFFKELRENRPVLTSPVCTLVARFHDVMEVLSTPEVFTAALYGPKMKDYLMTHDDDPLHTREKSIMRSMLNRDDLPFVRKMVADIGRGILDKANGKIEVVNDYCRMVPATLVQEYFGLKDIDKKDLIEWSYWNQYDAFHNYPFDIVTDEMRLYITDHHNEADKSLGEYMTSLITRRLVEVKAEQATSWLSPMVLFGRLAAFFRSRKNQPLNDDIVTRMLRTSYPEAMDFDIQRLGLNAGGLLIGAVETTSQAVAQVIQFLLNDEKWLRQAIDASQRQDIATFDGIVWEALRFAPISSFLFRKAAQNYTICKGTKNATIIRAGTIVLALTQSAMFDSAAFEIPDDFSPERDWYRYFHFGFGIHECLGKYVAMVMIPEMVRQVLIRPAIAAIGTIDYKSGPLPENYRLSWSGR